LSVSRILLIDDNYRLRKMARVMLTTAGYDVEEAANGRAGVACYRLQPSDLVITDILMPEQEGLETIRELRLLDPAVKIIAMSGAAQDRAGYLDLALKFGARRTLQKPFTLDELLMAVTEVLAP
jgi:two-component system, chemotaxis family, chemotaxis protein CheY